MKLPKSLGKLLENKFVLYFVLFLAITNIFGYMVTENNHAILIFIVLGLITRYFTKNMIVILAVPLVFTSFFMVGSAIKEGMTSSSDDTKEPNKDAKVD